MMQNHELNPEEDEESWRKWKKFSHNFSIDGKGSLFCYLNNINGIVLQKEDHKEVSWGAFDYANYP